MTTACIPVVAGPVRVGSVCNKGFELFFVIAYNRIEYVFMEKGMVKIGIAVQRLGTTPQTLRKWEATGE